MGRFVEEQLDVGYDYGVVGGPMFKTEIVERGSGHEDRNAKWRTPLGKWELGERDVTHEKWSYIRDFFYSMRGREVGFRFRDWTDFEAVDEVLDPDGSPTVQLRKTYQSTLGDPVVRVIKKPVGTTVSLARGGNDESFDLVNDATGVLSLSADFNLSITDVTASAPAELTFGSNHGLNDGDVVWILGTSLSEIDQQTWTVTVIDSTTIALDNSDTSGTSGSSSGTLEFYAQPGETLTWSGEFDIPARFDSDELTATFEAADFDGPVGHAMGSLPVKELRNE